MWSDSKNPTIRLGCRVVRFFFGTGPLEPTLESASPSPPQGSIWHRFNIDSTLIRFDIDSTSISWLDRVNQKIDVGSMSN